MSQHSRYLLWALPAKGEIKGGVGLGRFIMAAEHSLIGCGSLPLMLLGFYLTLVAGIKLTFGIDKFYSRLPITRTLANLNLMLTRTKLDFPWISFIHLLYIVPLVTPTSC